MVSIMEYKHVEASPLPPDLDHHGKVVKTLHETDRPRGDAAAGKRLTAPAQRGEVCTRARTPLEQHALGLYQVHDRFHIVLDGVDEAGRALRFRLHTYVEPHRRIEAHFLLHEEMSKVVLESVSGRR